MNTFENSRCPESLDSRTRGFFVPSKISSEILKLFPVIFTVYPINSLDSPWLSLTLPKIDVDGFLPYYLLFGVSPLLGLWRSHSDYQKFLVENLLSIYSSDQKRVSQYASILTKLYLLDLDRIKSLVSEVYSRTGAPARLRQEPEAPTTSPWHYSKIYWSRLTG